MIIGIAGRIGSGKDTMGKMIQYLDSHSPRPYDEWVKPRIFKGQDIGDLSMYEIEEGSWQIKKFAGKLKQIASLMTGIPVEKFEDQEFKKTKLGPEWSQWVVRWKHGDDGPGKASFKTRQELDEFVDMCFEDSVEDIESAGLITFEELTVREFLQKLGTDAVREGLHTNTWVNALFADYTKITSFSSYARGARVTPDSLPKWIITDTRFPNEAKAIKENGGIVIKVVRELPKQEYTTLEQKVGLHPSETALDNWEFDEVIENDKGLDKLLYMTEKLLTKHNLLVNHLKN